MKLYHGTFEDNYKSILKDGEIRGYFLVKNEATELIDIYLDKYGETPNLRSNALFLSSAKEAIEAYDYAFVVDAKDLNTNLLYVGDFEIINELYLSIMDYKHSLRKIKMLVNSYENNFIAFNEYLDDKNRIKVPEFLYFGDISLDKAILYEEIAMCV